MRATTLLRIAALAAACAACGQALACGTCAEDKIAATYDHATVQRAAAAGQVMVYCELSGRWDEAALRRAASRVRGVDARSVKVAREPAALSFALDAKQQSARAAVLALQAAVPPGARVAIVRVDAPARH
jgi:hypothetical protein